MLREPDFLIPFNSQLFESHVSSSELKNCTNLIAQPFEIQVRKLGRKKRLAKWQKEMKGIKLLNQTAERAKGETRGQRKSHKEL